MISHRKRESRRRLPKLSKNLERLYKERKCRDCTVVVTQMDFAKILGKFTKVKIQFESSTTPKTKKVEITPPNTNTRLKSNENGMVLIHRNAYNQHPVKELLSPKKSKPIPPKIETPVRQISNILKETPIRHVTNIVKETPVRQMTNIVKETPVRKMTNIVKEPPVRQMTNIVKETPVRQMTNIVKETPVRQMTNIVKKTPVRQVTNIVHETPVRQTSNILKENNRLKKTPVVKDKIPFISNFEGTKIKTTSHLKQYGIIFMNPSQNNNKNDLKSKTTLQSLLPVIDKSILPSEEWCIEYLPIIEEPTDDKVYDRIAAELEDLMYNEKPAEKSEVKPDASENKVDDFPSIMDILNDNSNESSIKSNDQSTSVEFKTNLESSDVEAMLLGKSTELSKQQDQSTPMEVDSSDMSKLIEDVARVDATEVSETNQNAMSTAPDLNIDEIDNPQSPSILDEALQKGIEEHLPLPSLSEPTQSELTDNTDTKVIKSTTSTDVATDSCKKDVDSNPNNEKQKFTRTDVTHIIFKKNINGSCHKRVTCPKNLKYTIELDGKHVELIGAPKFISSLEDLQVLLQIVNDTELQSLYILY